jgi:hypothetical protein
VASVPNGTVVFFLTDLGRVDAEANTKDGFARVNLVSDSRSGAAHVTAFSGGSAAPLPSATPSPGAQLSFGIATAYAGKNSATITVNIGSAQPKTIIVTASPARITSPRWALVTANVFDPSGNAVFNVPVIFKVSLDKGVALEETLDSGSVPLFTDTNGQAFDTLRTRSIPGSAQKSVVVSANLPNGSSSTVTAFIN